jgi:transposase InsO family protein
MPWVEKTVLDQKMKLIGAYLEGEKSIVEILEDLPVTRATAHKWLKRYREEGPSGLLERSRAPHHNPNAFTEEQEDIVIGLRCKHARWGARKLKAWLERYYPEERWPSPSTIGDLLHCNGLTKRHRKNARLKAGTSYPLTAAGAPNQVWCVDFKGWFFTQDGKRCYTFTLTDLHSRYLLRCQALSHTDEITVKPLLMAAFMEYGLPEVIRSDNGPPFASVGLGGLSKLSLWWLKLGIRPERIEPGCPYQNGCHERMHRTLKEDVLGQPERNRRAQQRAFDAYLGEYNEERPHEALGYLTPADLYATSSRPCPRRVPELVYPLGFEVRRVHQNGCIRWDGREIFVSEVLVREPVGLWPLEERLWAVYVGPLALAVMDEGQGRCLPAKKAAPMLQALQEVNEN